MRDIHPSEAAMRVMLIVQRAQRRDPHFIIRDVVEAIREQLELSRAQAHRLARQAIDLLGIAYDCDEIRILRTKERRVDTRINTLSQRRAA